MADIAMLVAEEYERRLKIAEKAVSAAGGPESDGRRRFEVVYSVAPGLKKNKNLILSFNDWVWEPRTQIGVAASHSFFSA